MKVFGTSLNPTTLAVGAGAVLLAPIVIPFVAGIMRPVAKTAIKGGLLAYEKAKVITTEAIESLEDLAAEAKSEIAEQPEIEPEPIKPKKAAAAKGAKA